MPNHIRCISITAFMIYVHLLTMCVCVLYINLRSSLTHNIFVCVFMGSVVFLGRCSMVLCSAGSGVNSVQVVLSGLSMKLYFWVLCIVSVMVTISVIIV